MSSFYGFSLPGFAHQCVLILLLVVSSQLMAVDFDEVVIDSTFQHLTLGEYLYFKPDFQQVETAESAFRSLSSNDNAWQPFKADSIDGQDTRQYWIAFKVNNISVQPLSVILNYDYAWLWDFSAYLFHDGVVYKDYQSGHKYPFVNRPEPLRTFSMSFELDPKMDYWLIIRAQGRVKQLHSFLNFYEERYFYHSFERRERVIWLYYGVMVVMAIYNVVLFFSIRESIYLNFGVFVAAIFSVYFAINGHGFEVFWPSFPGFNERSSVFFSLLVIISNVHFYTSFLNIKNRVPVFFKMCRGLQFVAGFMLIYVCFVSPRDHVFVIVMLYLMLVVFYMFSFAVSLYLQYEKGVREAKHYNLSFGIFCVMAVCYVLQDASFIDTNIITLYGVFIGQMLMVVVLSLVLADRINILKDERQYAKAESYAKSEILARMSHEIRTPMNGVLGMSELLSTTSLNEKQKEYNHAIYSSGNALLGIINDILDFSKIEAGKMVLDCQHFNLEERALETLAMFRLKAAEKGVQLILQYHEGTGRWFDGDPVRLQQILINYLDNALKFTDHGEVILRITWTDKEQLRLEVQDSGIGIEKEKLPYLFQVFSQADANISRHYGGTGLGLAICKQLADLMGGGVGVESEVGKGARFYAVIEGMKPLQEQPVLDALECERLKERRILMVDACCAYTHSLENLFFAWGVEGDIASTVEQAIEYLQNTPRQSFYDVIVIDMVTLGASAVQLAKTLQQTPHRNQARLLLTCSALERNSEALKVEAGVDNVVEKPMQASALYFLLGELLGFAPTIKPLPTPLAGNGSEVFECGALRVLVVEDNPLNQKVVSGMLKHIGLDFTLAEDGAVAVETYRKSQLKGEGRYSLILMDCEMPVMDGYQATHNIRAIEKHRGYARVPIYALTAHAVQDHVDHCFEVGMDGCLAKPIKIDTIKQLIEKCTGYASV